jgi:hypothetical protein
MGGGGGDGKSGGSALNAGDRSKYCREEDRCCRAPSLNKEKSQVVTTHEFLAPTLERPFRCGANVTRVREKDEGVARKQVTAGKLPRRGRSVVWASTRALVARR